MSKKLLMLNVPSGRGSMAVPPAIAWSGFPGGSHPPANPRLQVELEHFRVVDLLSAGGGSMPYPDQHRSGGAP